MHRTSIARCPSARGAGHVPLLHTGHAPGRVSRPHVAARPTPAAPPSIGCLSSLRLPGTAPRPHDLLRCRAAVAEAPAATRSGARKQPITPKVVFSKRLDEASLDVEVVYNSEGYQVSVRSLPGTPGRRVLHWATDDWKQLDPSLWPPGTVKMDNQAVQTPVSDGTPFNVTFPEAVCPGTIVFVVKELEPERWINGGGSHFTIVLRQPDASSIARKVINAEATYSHWSLFNRFCLVNEVLDAAVIAGPPGMALVFTWLRLSSTRVLPWYKNSNYQSKDIAHVQQAVAQNMASKARSAEDPWSRAYARMALAGLPRGGGNGDDIRMGILNIMRANGIKEGHRPGLDEKFLEQWHQKLHQNTTQDDIYICEAYLAFLHSGNHDDYWRVLWERGRLTREDLENFGNPVKAWPMHLPHLIDPFKHYLWILKVTHSGADLDTAFTMSQGLLDDETRWVISDILKNRNEWWVPGKIVEARHKLANFWKQPGASRDLLLLDIALESWFRTLIERMDVRDQPEGGRDNLVDVIGLVLANAGLGLESEELAQCAGWWASLAGRPRWNQDWSLEALATVQRTELSLAAVMDTIYSQVQPYAEQFGTACKIDPKYIANFGEEVVRGHPAFILSSLLSQLEPLVREAAGVSSWQIVSQAHAEGDVQVIASLADVQGKEYDKPVILIAEKVGGMEDIPANVTAVLTRSMTDVLSHVAIRARSQGALLASCFDAAEWASLQQLQGKRVALSVGPDGAVTASDAPAPSGGAGAGAGAAAGGKLVLQAVEVGMQGPWVLEEKQFTPTKVGGKSLNLAMLRARLPAGLSVPTCLTLPFGTFERVLASNPETAAKLRSALAPLQAQGPVVMPEVSKALEQARSVVATGLTAPAELVQELASRVHAAGLIPSAQQWNSPGSPEWAEAWSAICRVWASKWTERAWLSRRARGVRDEELYMAVLLQQVVPAQYAFVLHTANPITHDPSEAVGEMVVGMGETLVGSHPGRALGFSATSAGPKLTGFPSKRLALMAPSEGTLIARSDANGEDLENFAGAGLYDSVPFSPLEDRPIDYAADPVVWDGAFRHSLLSQLTKASGDIKAAFEGRDQDIEGVYSGGKLYIVQARPQVMPGSA